MAPANTCRPEASMVLVASPRRNLTANGPGGTVDLADIADLPQVGSYIERGHPIATIFARGGSTDEVAACLKARVATAEEQLYA